jgi:hypothetical protein
MSHSGDCTEFDPRFFLDQAQLHQDSANNTDHSNVQTVKVAATRRSRKEADKVEQSITQRDRQGAAATLLY